MALSAQRRPSRRARPTRSPRASRRPSHEARSSGASHAPRRTKIVCTLGPSVASYAKVLGLARAGMDVARLNLSHAETAVHSRFIRWVRRAERALGRPIAVLADLAGPKIRTGPIAAGRASLEKGSIVTLTTRAAPGDARLVSVSYPRLPHEVRRGHSIMLADGTMELVVEEVRGGDIRCRVATGGTLTSHKGVNLPHSRLSVPSLTAKDRRDLVWAVRAGVDLVALSFVRKARDLQTARALLRRLGGRQPLIAKIEKQEALDRLDDILEAADGAMVARGDLGVETPLARVPMVQKDILRRLREMGKPSITATQMLKSMVDAPRPTRAEVSDVANAILDGTDAVMLSEETAAGLHPVAAVQVMDRVARETETAHAGRFAPLATHAAGARSLPQALSESAFHVAEEVGAAAIVTPTTTGRSARLVSRLRPAMPILGLSHEPTVLRQLCLAWGVVPHQLRRLDDLDAMAEAAGSILLKQRLAARGDRFVLTAGYPFEGVPTNLLVVRGIPSRGGTPGKRGRRR